MSEEEMTPVETTKPKRKRKTAKKKALTPKAKPKRRAKPRHWTETKAQLVIHSTPQLVAKLDRALTRLGKRLKLEVKPTRGSVVRALVEAAVK